MKEHAVVCFCFSESEVFRSKKCSDGCVFICIVCQFIMEKEEALSIVKKKLRTKQVVSKVVAYCTNVA